MHCAAHRDRPAAQYCEKTRVYLCGECASCRAPTRYCEFRSRCLIWNRDEEMEKSDGAAS